MDEVSLVGGEEVEWHRRMTLKGWRIVYLPDVHVTHFGSETVGSRPELELEYLKGMLNFFDKHRPHGHGIALRVVAGLVFTFRWAAAAIRGDRDSRRLAAMGMRVITSRR